jgi:hypothetical protein
VAWTAIAVGAALLAAVIGFSLTGASRLFALACGLAGFALGALYLVSPTWRIAVAVDDEALEVTASGDRRFLLPWAEVSRVVAAPSTSTCFLDGGDPSRSLLVPGPGAPAPYVIERREELYRAILERVPAGIVVEVDSLAGYGAEAKGDREA